MSLRFTIIVVSFFSHSFGLIFLQYISITSVFLLLLLLELPQPRHNLMEVGPAALVDIPAGRDEGPELRVPLFGDTLREREIGTEREREREVRAGVELFARSCVHACMVSAHRSMAIL